MKNLINKNETINNVNKNKEENKMKEKNIIEILTEKEDELKSLLEKLISDYLRSRAFGHQMYFYDYVYYDFDTDEFFVKEFHMGLAEYNNSVFLIKVDDNLIHWNDDLLFFREFLESEGINTDEIDYEYESELVDIFEEKYEEYVEQSIFDALYSFDTLDDIYKRILKNLEQ